MIALNDDIRKLEQLVEQIKKDKERAVGALNEIKKQLGDFGCKSLKEAKAKLLQLEKQEREQAIRYLNEMKKFKLKHQKILSRYQLKLN